MQLHGHVKRKCWCWHLFFFFFFCIHFLPNMDRRIDNLQLIKLIGKNKLCRFYFMFWHLQIYHCLSANIRSLLTVWVGYNALWADNVRNESMDSVVDVFKLILRNHQRICWVPFWEWPQQPYVSTHVNSYKHKKHSGFLSSPIQL